MKLYRIARTEYIDDLSGLGAFLYGGRWNSKGLYALYGAEHISLAALEIVVNYNRSTCSLLPNFSLLEMEILDTDIIEIDPKAMKQKWDCDIEYTQIIGDEFIKSNSLLTLKVPSAVIPEESNFLINPHHINFKKIKFTSTRKYGLDNRLFKN